MKWRKKGKQHHLTINRFVDEAESEKIVKSIACPIQTGSNTHSHQLSCECVRWEHKRKNLIAPHIIFFIYSLFHIYLWLGDSC